MGEFIRISAKDGRDFAAYLALPAQANGAGLVVLPEVYNVNAWVRSVADRYAQEGYTVVVPDLFWRQAPGVYLDYDKPEQARAQGAAIDVDAVVGDVGQAAAALRERLGGEARIGEAKIGVVGFCIGGRLAVLAGAREALDAVVSYYGVQLESHLDELASLAKPALLHFAENDPWVPPDVVAQVGALYAGRANVAVHLYPGAGHGFARNGYPPFAPEADQLAGERSRAHLAASLLGKPS